MEKMRKDFPSLVLMVIGFMVSMAYGLAFMGVIERERGK